MGVDLNIGGINISISINESIKESLADVKKSVDSVKNSAESASKNFNNSWTKTAAALTLVGAGITKTFQNIISNFAQTGDRMEKMSQRTGISVKALQELDYAANKSGTSLQEIQMSIKQLQTVITEAADGSQQYADSFKNLGLYIETIKNLSPEEQFQTVADAIAAIQDPTVKAARAVEFFGRNGTALLPMLSEGADGLKNLRNQASEVGYVMSEEAAHQGVVFGDTLDDIRTAARGVFNIIAEQLLPIVLKFAKIMKTIAVSIKNFVNKYRTLFEIAGVVVGTFGAFSLALGSVITAIIAVAVAFAGFGAVLATLGAPITITIAAVAGLTAGAVLLWKNWDTVSEFLIYSWSEIKKAFLTSIAVMLEGLSKLPVIGKKFATALIDIQKVITDETIKQDERLLANATKRFEEQQKKNKESLKQQGNDTGTALKVEKSYYKALINFQINAGEKTLADKRDFIQAELKAVKLGTLKEVELRQTLLDVDKQIADEQAKATDARIAYEKSQFEKYSVEKQKAVLLDEQAQIKIRLEAVKVGTQEYNQILQQEYENKKALDELENFNMVNGFSNALQEMTNQALNFKDITMEIFSVFRNALQDSFYELFIAIGEGFENFGQTISNIMRSMMQSILKIIAGIIAEIVAKWIASSLLSIVQSKTEGFAKVATNSAIAGTAAAAWMASISPYAAPAFGALIGAQTQALGIGLMAFEQGGIVPGTSWTGDNVLARMDSGEMIINRADQSNLWSAIKSGNFGGSGGSSAVINQNFEINGNGSLEDMADAVERGTLSALRFAGLTYNLGAKQAGVSV